MYGTRCHVGVCGGVGVLVYRNLMRVSRLDAGHGLGVLRVHTKLRRLSTVYE